MSLKHILIHQAATELNVIAMLIKTQSDSSILPLPFSSNTTVSYNQHILNFIAFVGSYACSMWRSKDSLRFWSSCPPCCRQSFGSDPLCRPDWPSLRASPVSSISSPCRNTDGTLGLQTLVVLFAAFPRPQGSNSGPHACVDLTLLSAVRSISSAPLLFY